MTKKPFRGRDLSQCANPYKSHLYRLPDMDKATEKYTAGKNTIALIPIFQTLPGDTSIEHHITRSAAWCRKSWLENSDAISQGVGFKFYVEDQVKDRVIPILRASHVDIDNDTLFFDGDMLSSERNHLGKKMTMFVDKQFAEYEWVTLIDSDSFLAKPVPLEQGVPDPVYPALSVFEYLQRHDKTIGSIYAMGTQDMRDMNNALTTVDLHWIQRILDTDRSDLKAQEWVRRVRDLTSDEVADLFESKSWYHPFANGGVYFYPAKLFHETKQDDIDWLRRASISLQDDEAVFSVYMLHTNTFLWSLHHDIGVMNALTPSGMMESRSKGEVYVLHLANMVYEWQWQCDIGVTT